MPSEVRAVGVPWYSRQDYHRVLEIMEDADQLPRGYDQWLKRAEEVERNLKRSGHIVIRAAIDPGEFPDWCRAQGLDIDANARNRWASEAAYRAVKNTH